MLAGAVADCAPGSDRHTGPVTWLWVSTWQVGIGAASFVETQGPSSVVWQPWLPRAAEKVCVDMLEVCRRRV